MLRKINVLIECYSNGSQQWFIVKRSIFFYLIFSYGFTKFYDNRFSIELKYAMEKPVESSTKIFRVFCAPDIA